MKLQQLVLVVLFLTMGLASEAQVKKVIADKIEELKRQESESES